MKIEYKNFIPKEYINKLELKKNNYLNMIIIIFLIFNFSLLPKSINKIYENKKVVEVISLSSDTIDYSKAELIEIINLLDLRVDYLEIKDGKGLVKIKKKEEIYTIDKYINIRSINKELDGYYSLDVEL